jgi:anti-anti-sigma factor
MPDILHGPAFVPADSPDTPGIALLRVVADLEIATIPATKRQLAAVLDVDPAHRAVIVDFDIDAFVSAQGLRLLLDLNRRLRSSNGRLLLCGPPPGLRRMIEVLNLGHEIELLATVHEAIATAES